MQAKILALFTTPSGLALIITFLTAGFTAISGNNSALTDIVMVLTAIGGIFHPTTMIGGMSVPKQ